MGPCTILSFSSIWKCSSGSRRRVRAAAMREHESALCPEGDSSPGSSFWHAVCTFVPVHAVRLLLVPFCNAVAGWDNFCCLMRKGQKI